MMNRQTFADKQYELMAGFGRYVFDHPEVDDLLPRKFFLYFELAGEKEFNAYSLNAAARHKLEKGYRPVRVRIDGLVQAASSELINPVIEVVKKPAKFKLLSPRFPSPSDPSPAPSERQHNPREAIACLV